MARAYSTGTYPETTGTGILEGAPDTGGIHARSVAMATSRSGADPTAARKSLQQTTLFASGPVLALGTSRTSSPSLTASLPCSTPSKASSSGRSEAGMSEATSILSSAEAYTRKAKMDEQRFKIGETVQVKLSLRYVSMGGGFLVSNLTLKREAVKSEALTSKRRKYDMKEKQKIVDIAREHGTYEAARRANLTAGFQNVHAGMVRRWRRELDGGRSKKKAGRKGTPDAFNVAVLGELVFASVEDIDNENRLRVEANVAYSYAIIQAAAQRVQQWPQFCDDSKVKDCKFSRKWVQRWLREVEMRKRRITSTAKTLPPPEQVQSEMREIQESLDDFTLDEVISADETAILFCQQPLTQYVPANAERAVSEKADDKARLTAMLWGTAAGKMGPIFAIIKCSSAKADLSKTRVLNSLSLVPGFTAADGWTLKTWVKTLSITVKRVDKDVKFTIPYLVHDKTLAIVTIQHKAWMDTARVCMWMELQLGPLYERKRGRVALIWDNCGPHGTSAATNMAAENGIYAKRLPKNMTDTLQVMDLIVNSPLKAGARKERCQRTFEYFQAWKIRRLKAQRDKAEPPPFEPPKPTVADGLLTLMKVLSTTLATTKFEDSMRKCFVDVGLAPAEVSPDTATYKIYTEHKRGSLNPKLWQPEFCVPDGASLADAIDAYDEMEIMTRSDALDDLGVDNDSDEEESEAIEE